MRWLKIDTERLMVAVLLTAIWVFCGTGTAFTQDAFVEIARLINPDLEPEAWFGNMAISGNTIVVGAHGDDLPGMTDAGSAHVFVGSGSTWVLQQSFTAPDVAPGRQVRITPGYLRRYDRRRRAVSRQPVLPRRSRVGFHSYHRHVDLSTETRLQRPWRCRPLR